MRRAEINDSPVMRFIEEEDAVLNESSYFPLRAKKVSEFLVDEEEKFGLPRPDMTKIVSATPEKKPRAINPYEDGPNSYQLKLLSSIEKRAIKAR